jgi:Rrf2 family protein
MVLDLAQHYRGGPVQLGDIARRQNISLKYLEQIIRPLKKADYVKSFRGAKGGHMLNKPPEEITVGEIVALLEGGNSITQCSENPGFCDRADNCITRYLWLEASKAMYERLRKISFADLLALEKNDCKDKYLDYIVSQQELSQNPSCS